MQEPTQIGISTATALQTNAINTSSW